VFGDETQRYTGVFGDETQRYTGVFGDETQRYTGVFGDETQRYTGVFGDLPQDLQTVIHNLQARTTSEELKSAIQKLCAWQPLTAQGLVELLKRRSKNHLVRNYLTPMVKEGELNYLYPEDEDSPHQAYVVRKD
jgi:hypothetical protein